MPDLNWTKTAGGYTAQSHGRTYRLDRTPGRRFRLFIDGTRAHCRDETLKPAMQVVQDMDDALATWRADYADADAALAAAPPAPEPETAYYAGNGPPIAADEPAPEAMYYAGNGPAIVHSGEAAAVLAKDMPPQPGDDEPVDPTKPDGVKWGQLFGRPVGGEKRPDPTAPAVSTTDPDDDGDEPAEPTPLAPPEPADANPDADPPGEPAGMAVGQRFAVVGRGFVPRIGDTGSLSIAYRRDVRPAPLRPAFRPAAMLADGRPLVGWLMPA